MILQPSRFTVIITQYHLEPDFELGYLLLLVPWPCLTLSRAFVFTRKKTQKVREQEVSAQQRQLAECLLNPMSLLCRFAWEKQFTQQWTVMLWFIEPLTQHAAWGVNEHLVHNGADWCDEHTLLSGCKNVKHKGHHIQHVLIEVDHFCCCDNGD